MKDIAQENRWYKELPIPSYANWGEKSFLVLSDLTSGIGLSITLQMMLTNQIEYALLCALITSNTVAGSVGGRAILQLRRYL